MKAYKINLSQTQLDGSFPCPSCQNRISPDDETDENYHFVKYANKTVIVQCQKCKNKIVLSLREEKE